MKPGVTLGHAGALALHLDLEILLRTRLLVQANSGAGKSWCLRRLAEQLFGKVQVLLIDPEGEFATLRERYGYVLVGKGGETPADPRSAVLLAHKLLELHASAVCDLYEVKPSERHRWVRLFLEALIDAPKRLWHPVVVIVDESHSFCPEKGAGESEASDAMIGLATRGRKRGFAAVFATQRLGKLRKDAASELLNVLIGGTFIDIDRKRAAEALGIPRSDEKRFFDEIKVLEPGTFWALGRAISTERVRVKIGPVMTTHPEPGSTKHAAEPPPPPDKVKALLPKLADLPKEAEARAKTEGELRQEIRSLRAQLVARPKEIVQVEKPGPVPKRIEIPVLKEGQLTRLEKWLSGVTAEAERHGKALAMFWKQMDENASALLGVFQHVLNIPTPPVSARPTLIREQQAQRPIGRPPLAMVSRRAEPGEQVGPARQRILDALSFLEEIGGAQADKTQLALMAGARPTSGGYFNNLGSLRSGGLIVYPEPTKVALTEAGRAQANSSRAPASTQELHELIQRKLPPAKWRILEVLIAVYPKPLAKDELAARVGVSPTSGGYFNNLGSLRSLGLIDYPASGQVVARPVLFLEERA